MRTFASVNCSLTDIRHSSSSLRTLSMNVAVELFAFQKWTSPKRVDFLNHLRINCPSDNSDSLAEMAASHAMAFAMLRDMCPVGARVTDVAGIRKKGKYKCAWQVRYVRDNEEHIDPEQLVREILNSKPPNTEIVRKDRHFPPALQLDYSITCGCPISKNTGKLINRNDFVEEIKVELVNLKVEDNTVE